jgi:hypothetical protein
MLWLTGVCESSGLAYKNLIYPPELTEISEDELIWLGMVGMIDELDQRYKSP